jgi:hypothetical protein
MIVTPLVIDVSRLGERSSIVIVKKIHLLGTLKAVYPHWQRLY